MATDAENRPMGVVPACDLDPCIKDRAGRRVSTPCPRLTPPTSTPPSSIDMRIRKGGWTESQAAGGTDFGR